MHRASISLPLSLALALSIVLLCPGSVYAQLDTVAKDLKLNTFFQFTSEDSTDDASDRTIALLGISISAKYGFNAEKLSGSLSIKYQGSLKEDETIRTGEEIARSQQKYTVNLGFTTTDGVLSLATEMKTKDTYSRRNRYDSILATDTFQSATGTAAVNKAPYPTFTASVKNVRTTRRRKVLLTSSQNLTAVVSSEWKSGPFKMNVARIRTESRTDLTGAQTMASEQTMVNFNSNFPLSTQWKLAQNFNYTEDVRSYGYQHSSQKSQSTLAQIMLNGSDIAPGLSAKAELKGNQRVDSTSSVQNSTFSQGVNLTYKVPGEIIGDDVLTFAFGNSDNENSGRNINIRKNTLGWRFAPFSKSTISVSYTDQVSTDNNTKTKNDERTIYDIRFSYNPGKFSLQGGYNFNLFEGGRDQESRTNALGVQMGYKVNDQLSLNLRLNQRENRNIPANPLSKTVTSEQTEWEIGTKWKPVETISIEGKYRWLTQDSTISDRSRTKSLQFRLNYSITRNIRLTVDFRSNDDSRFGDPLTGGENTVFQTMLQIDF